MKTSRWRRAWLLAPFGLSVFVLMAACASRGATLFGDKHLLFGDGQTQLLPFLSAFRKALTTGTNLQYTLYALLGTDPIDLYAYYLASPFNLIVLLFPADRIIDAHTLIVLLKIGTVAAAFAYYACRALKADRFAATLFSLGYALMGWVFSSWFFISWLDALIWLPLICLSAHILVERGAPVPLTLCFFAMFWSNYYVGYMVAVFSAVYFAALIAIQGDRTNWRRFLGRGALFAASGLIAFGMVACVVFPTFLQMRAGTEAFGNTAPRLDYTAYKWDGRFSSLLPLVPALLSGVNWDGWDLALYCGTLTATLAVGFFCCRAISARKRAVAGIALVGLMYSMTQNNWSHLAWHLMAHPTGFIYRQSFLLSFAIAVLATTMFARFRRKCPDAGRAAVRGGIAMLFTLLVYNGVVPRAREVPIWGYTANLVFVGVGALLLYLGAAHRQKRAWSAVCAALLVLMCGDVYNNASQILYEFSFSSRQPIEDKQAAVWNKLDDMAVAGAGLYRVGNAEQSAYNDGLLFGYPSSTIYSSSANVETVRFLNAASSGVQDWTKFNAYVPNLMTDTLLGFRYFLRVDDTNALYPVTHMENGGSYQENPFALPLIFVSPGSFETIPELDVPETQQALLHRVAPDATASLILDPAEADALHALYICPKDGPVYLYGSAADIEVRLNGQPVLPSQQRHPLLCIARAGDRIEVTVAPVPAQIEEGEKEENVLAWRVMQIDQHAFTATVRSIQRKTLSLERLSDTAFVAEVACNPGDRLFVTLPYKDGWALSVDGQPVQLQRALNVLMGADMMPGTHEVRLTYTRPGGKLGMAITCLSCGALFVCVGITLTRRRKSANPQSGSTA